MGSTPRLPRVSLRDVSRSYGRSFALHRVGLTFDAGSITAVVGDNGAGKSTLLDILATVESPSSGTIAYGETSRTDFARRHRHRIGWVSHQSPLYGELTARENLEFVARMHGIDDVEKRSRSWLERVGLTDDADRHVEYFSRGMKQRLTIARALIQSPRLLLLDEPTTGLDQSGTETVRRLLAELRNRDRIVVIVSHDLEFLAELADHVVILRRGQVTADRPLDASTNLAELYKTHA